MEDRDQIKILLTSIIFLIILVCIHVLVVPHSFRNDTNESSVEINGTLG